MINKLRKLEKILAEISENWDPSMAEHYPAGWPSLDQMHGQLVDWINNLSLDGNEHADVKAARVSRVQTDRHNNQYRTVFVREWNHNPVGFSFTVYNDSLITVKYLSSYSDGYEVVYCCLIVDGAACKMHQKRYEAGRPKLRQKVDALAAKLESLKKGLRPVERS